MVYQRGCLVCGAQFLNETDEKTLEDLQKHLDKCKRDKPFYNDGNAIYYED